MPGKLINGNEINSIPREIHSDLKSKRIIWEPEKPVRWSFMKVLRETSNLKEFYPEINPYTECYKVRENTWALYNDSFDGAGDVWMYLINGPKRALLVDTSFGVGDLKGLIHHLIGEKELIVCNTHAHFDHCYGNAQFEKVYCHEYEVPDMKTKNNAHIWDYLLNQTGAPLQVADRMIEPGMPIFTEFDPQDIIEYHPYEIIGIPDGHLFDLGEGYLVEAVLLPGHTPGQCGFYDHQTHCIFTGDTSGMAMRPKGTPYREFCCVEAMAEALTKLKPRFKEISGVFPGHGAWDQSPIVLQYLLDACNSILEDPNNYNEIQEFERDGKRIRSAIKHIQQGSSVRYDPRYVTKKQILDDEKEPCL